jgi:CubicO group peptidase (beta-lactamase class C family)
MVDVDEIVDKTDARLSVRDTKNVAPTVSLPTGLLTIGRRFWFSAVQEDPPMRLPPIILAAALLGEPATAAYNWSQLDATLASLSANASYPAGGGLIVTHKGSVVYQAAFGSWTTSQTQQPVPVYSVSKAVAAVIALAIDQNSAVPFSITDTSGIYISSFGANDPNLATVTIRQLMANTGGYVVANNINEPCLDNYTVTLPACASNVWAGTLVTAGVPSGSNLYATPGTQFIYTGGGWQTLGLALENATGKRWRQLARDYLSTPCTLPNLYYAPSGTAADSKNAWIAGGVQMNLTDGGKFAELLRTGRCGSTTVLSLTSLNKMRANQLNGAAITSSPYSDGRTYGYGLWRNDFAGSTNLNLYSHAGAGGAHPWYDTARNYSAFLLVNEPTGGSPSGFQKGKSLYEAIRPLIEAQVDANP